MYKINDSLKEQAEDLSLEDLQKLASNWSIETNMIWNQQEKN